MKQKDVVVLITHRNGSVDAEFTKCLDALRPHGIGAITTVGCWLDHARSYLASFAMQQTEYPVLLHIDDDIIFKPEDVLSVVATCIERECIVAVPYAGKKPEGFIVGKFPKDLNQVKFFGEGGLYPGDMCGMGFTAIHRKVFEAVGEELPTLNISGHNYVGKPFFAHLWRDGRMWGEDFSFCMRASDAGFPLLFDTRIRLKHKGFYKYGIEDAGQQIQEIDSLLVNIKHEE